MKQYQIDAFTKEVFKGNPAAVCIVEDKISDAFMQRLAVENNLSETAFVEKKNDQFGLRWFTPAKEVPLCGHATLASAFVLFEESYVSKNEEITFTTLSGELKVRYEDGQLVMDFPANHAVPSAYSDISMLEELLGGEITEVLDYPDELVVIMKNVTELINSAPNMSQISALATNGVIVSAWEGSSDRDFVSRYFAPNLGINEDPVTGFIHTILTPYWANRKGQLTFNAYQASKREGHLKTELIEDRVILKGNAVKVFETDILF